MVCKSKKVALIYQAHSRQEASSFRVIKVYKNRGVAEKEIAKLFGIKTGKAKRDLRSEINDSFLKGERMKSHPEFYVCQYFYSLGEGLEKVFVFRFGPLPGTDNDVDIHVENAHNESLQEVFGYNDDDRYKIAKVTIHQEEEDVAMQGFLKFDILLAPTEYRTHSQLFLLNAPFRAPLVDEEFVSFQTRVPCPRFVGRGLTIHRGWVNIRCFDKFEGRRCTDQGGERQFIGLSNKLTWRDKRLLRGEPIVKVNGMTREWDNGTSLSDLDQGGRLSIMHLQDGRNYRKFTLHAAKDFSAGDYISLLWGEVYERSKHDKKFPHESFHTFDFTVTTATEQVHELTLDARERGSICRFAQNSCNPNAGYRLFLHEEKPVIVMYAIKDIARRDEITVFYRKKPSNQTLLKLRCNCKAANCSKKRFYPMDHDFGPTEDAMEEAQPAALQEAAAELPEQPDEDAPAQEEQREQDAPDPLQEAQSAQDDQPGQDSQAREEQPDEFQQGNFRSELRSSRRAR